MSFAPFQVDCWFCFNAIMCGCVYVDLNIGTYGRLVVVAVVVAAGVVVVLLFLFEKKKKKKKKNHKKNRKFTFSLRTLRKGIK